MLVSLPPVAAVEGVGLEQRFGETDAPRASVFAPSPLLTVTIEPHPDEAQIHFHPGGQGYWIARMAAALGVDVTLCTSFGGESGQVIRGLLDEDSITVRSIETTGDNGSYVHDRRSGERVEIAEMPAAPMSRHEIDELYGMTLVEGLEAGICVLGGPSAPDVIPADMYERLAEDLTANGATVVADLSGEPLAAVLAGGVAVVKVSDEELAAEQRADPDDIDSIVAAIHDLAARGASNVIVSRAERGMVALLDERLVEAHAPKLEAVDHRGAGDSLTAGVAAGLARGLSIERALLLGAAAGAMNVTRHGLATGTRDEIERLAERVECRPLDALGSAR